ncbi:MAG: hypothetical protein RL701_4747 [Pseudomonadota bacterium]
MLVRSDRDSIPHSNLRTFLLHSLAFVLPLVTLTFWFTGPHSWWAALLWTVPMIALYWLDGLAPPDQRQPSEQLPDWPYSLQLYALFAIQMANHVLLVVTASRLHVGSVAEFVQTAFMLVPTIALSGITAGYSGVVVSHELVHRRSVVEQTLGRILLVCVFYEHFATEHVRGHHPRVGTTDDPATARFGESHRQFLRRTIPAQFKSAWHLEEARLQLATFTWYSPRRLRHKVLQGAIAEVTLLCCIAGFFGPIALFFFLIQTICTLVLIETVNYIEHWGLVRSGKRVVAVDSWDAENWFTHYTLVGLARHSDHHAQASRPFQKLRHFYDTAKLPSGYYSSIMQAVMQNAKYRAYATAELQRRGLGPFRTDDHVAPAIHIHPSLQQQPQRVRTP